MFVLAYDFAAETRMMNRQRKPKDRLLQEILHLCEQLAELRARELASHPSRDIFFADQQRCMDVIEFLPDATFIVDGNGKVIAWNRAMEELTGVSKKDVLGKGKFEYSIPFYGKARPILIDYALAKEPGVDHYYDFVQKDANTIMAEVFAPRMRGGRGAYLWGKASPLRDREGRIVGAIESIRDITEWKQAEESLKKNEEQFRTLVETMNEGLSVQDEHGNIVYANDKLCEMMGYQREEVIGLPETTFFDEENRVILAKHREKRLQNLKSSYEIELLRRDGTRLPAIISGTPIFDARGSLRGTIATVTDITLQKRVESELRESEGKYRAIFENSPLGILHFDCHGIVTDCNAKLLEILGSEKSRVLGLNLLTSLRDKKMKTAVSACVRGRTASYEGSYLPVEGGRISYIKAEYGPIVSKDGEVLGGIAVLEDITQRKETLEALRLSEQRWTLLSSQLLATQEQERKELARSLQEAVGGPLEKAVSGLEELLAREKNAGKRKLLEETHLAVRGAFGGVNAVIEDLRPPLLDEQGLLAAVQRLCDQVREKRPSILVEARMDPREPNIPALLKIVIYRVLREALSDVLDLSKAQRVRVAVQEADSILKVTVRDDGLGFDPKEVLRKESGKRPPGLRKMKDWVELSGGSFTIESGPDRDTEICARWLLPGLSDLAGTHPVSSFPRTNGAP